MSKSLARRWGWRGGFALGIIVLITIVAFGCQGPAGVQGPAGPAGSPGPAGPAGPAGASGAPATPTPKPPAVTVSAGNPQTAAPGGSVTFTAAPKINDNSTVTGYKWEQVSGVKATLDGATTNTLKVTLGNAAAYKAKMFEGLEPLDRFGVQAINPHALTGAEVATFKVTVTTSSGSYSGTATVNTTLPYAISTGLASVAQGTPVLIGGKQQASYKWTIAGPTGTKATLGDDTTRNPYFTPDVAGKYTVTETVSKAAVDVYAGAWVGAISGQDKDGFPISADCTVCHNGTIASDNFKDWKKTGHAEIFKQNINDPAGHWAITCAGCHTVGYDDNTENGGFDAAVKAANWTAPPHGDKGLYEEIIVKYSAMAKTANIQCENCHGPNNSVLHNNKTIDPARVSLSSDVCGACHGEPLRHGRFQQWESSGHANFELAIEDATVENRAATAAHCGRCHSAQGFMKWITQGDLTKQIQGANGNATVDELKAMGLTKDQILPQTCVTCHDPHAEGSTTGEPTNATVRIMNDTLLLPAGFQAKEVGKGAICMTCHNTRNALHNQDNPPAAYSGPHEAAQADVLMGQNAYFVTTPDRSPHSYIKDTCVTCHMEETPPPAEFSYNRAGTNHSFKASLEMCASCHSKTLNGEALQAGIEDKLNAIGGRLSNYLLGKLPASFNVKDYTPHELGGKKYDVASNIVNISKDNIASIAPTETPLHGQEGFVIKFKNPVTFTYAPAGETPHDVTASQTEVQLGSITGADGKTAVIALTDNLVKAAWNFYLIKNDSSKGVHNPEFAHAVLDGAMDALK